MVGRLREPSARGVGRTRAPRRGTRRAERSGAGRWRGPRRDSRADPSSQGGPTRQSSYLHYDRENQRPAPGSVVDKLPDRVVQVLLEELDLAHALGEEIV